MCAPGEGPGGPDRALPARAPEAAPGARWERRPDAGRRHAGSGRVARARGPAGAHPPARARGTGVHRPAKGTFATFERARTRRGRGGDPASGASSACPAQPGRMAAAQRNAGAGEEQRGLGAGCPAHRGGLSELGCDGKMFIATWQQPGDSCSSPGPRRRQGWRGFQGPGSWTGRCHGGRAACLEGHLGTLGGSPQAHKPGGSPQEGMRS